MDKDEVTFTTWNKVAGLYEEKFMDLSIYNATYDIFCSKLKGQNPSVLDIGCGPGNISSYLLSARPGITLHGIDYAPAMVKLAQKNNPTAVFSVLDCREISHVNKQYDGIVCGFCIPYLAPAEVVKLISDCSQLIKQGGCLYLSFVDGNPTSSGFRVASTGDQTYFYFYQSETLMRLLDERDFKEPTQIKVQYEKAGQSQETHIVLIASKT